MSKLEQVKEALEKECSVTLVSETRHEWSTQLKTAEGPIINVFDKGTVQVQGKNKHLVDGPMKKLNGVQLHVAPSVTPVRTVFVVYGHDETARTELEAMLRRWRLEPIVLDQLTSEGDTLIEKLERYSQEIAFAVILATPDDEGHAKNDPTGTKFRARQNVVLELGMMLQKLGRKKVAILIKQLEDGVMERPSDIQGLIYIPFSDSVSDARVQLAKEMNKQGLSIDLDTL